MPTRRPLRAARAVAALAVLLAAALAADGAAQAAGGFRNGLVAFVRCCGGDDAGIFVVGPAGHGERRVYRPPADDAPLDPAWSPNGRLLAYAPGAPLGGLWTMRGNGTARHRVTRGRGDVLFPSWSPDGRRIVFADLGAGRRGFHDLFVVRTNGKGLVRLTADAADETHPAWAPNGGTIVYERGRDLWRMGVDGRGRRLLARNASSPSWSPGGSHIAFIRRGDPWVMARNGTHQRRVRHTPALEIGVAWSPDSRLLVTAPIDRGDLLLVAADGSSARPLTRAPELFNSWPAWQRLPRR